MTLVEDVKVCGKWQSSHNSDIPDSVSDVLTLPYEHPTQTSAEGNLSSILTLDKIVSD